MYYHTLPLDHGHVSWLSRHLGSSQQVPYNNEHHNDIVTLSELLIMSGSSLFSS